MADQKNDKKRLVDYWDEYDQNHPSNSYLRGDAEFAGPVRKRKCTDLGFLVLFIVLNLGLFYMSYYVINKGAPVRLSRGYDFRGAVCGQGDLSSIPYMYWPDPYTLDFSLCIESCPQSYIRQYYCVYENDHTTLYLDWCWDTIQSTTYGYYCVPIFEKSRKEVLNYLFETMQLFKRSVGDLLLAWDTILVGISVSVGVSFTFLIFFRFKFASISLMTLSIISNQVLLLFIIYLFYEAYKITYNLLCEGDGSLDPEYCYTPPSNGLLYCIFIIGFLTLLYPIIILFKVKTIKLSIGIIKLATQPFHTLKQIFFYPLMQLFLGGMVILFLIVIIIFTMSTGVISLKTSESIPGGKAKIIEYSETEKYFLIYNVIMSIWWIAFLIAFSEFVLSAAVSVWYFTRERSSLYFPLWRGFKLIVRYHLGSVVRGSLLSTLFKIPQLLLSTYKSFAILFRKKAPGCTDCMLRCCYCLSCYQKWLRYFSKYSYIFLALFGENYFEAARKSFYLIQRNKNRIFVPAKAGDFGMFLVKMTMTLAGTVVTLTLLLLADKTPVGQKTETLIAPIFVGIVATLCCAYVAQIFGGSMQACMNTIIICGACDEEMFTREQRYMYKDLIDYLDSIYEEMTEQQKEHKELIKIKESKKIYKKNKVIDESEAPSIMKSHFNQKTEISAPVQAMNIEDLEDEENIFALEPPKMKLNNNSFNNSALSAQRDPVANSSFRMNLETSNRNFKSEVNRSHKEAVEANRSNLNVSGNYGYEPGVRDPNSMLDPISVNRVDRSQNYLRPNASYMEYDRSLNNSVIEPSRPNQNSSFLSHHHLASDNRSFLGENRSFLGENRSLIGENQSFLGIGSLNNSRNQIRVNSNSYFNDRSFEEAIKVDANNSVEVEADDKTRPRFK